MRRYWLLMGLRVLCLALLFVVPRVWWWACILGALTAPLLAVLVANAGREGGGATSAERSGKDLVVLDGHAHEPRSDHGRPAPVYRVRPGEFLR